MSEKLFGRLYETIGSSSSDLLLKSKGSVKVQWGNKFIELIKDGNINYPKESIKKLIEETIAASLQQESEESEEIISLEDLKKELEEKIISEETSRSNSDEEIKSQIQDCIARIDKSGNISEIETSLKNLILEEKNRAINKELYIEDSISKLSTLLTDSDLSLEDFIAEEINRLGGITTLDLAQEKTDREAAITALDTAYKAADETLTAAIAQEKTDREEGDVELMNKINSVETNVIPVGGIILFNKGTSIPTSWKRLTTADYDVLIGEISYVYIIKE